MPEKHSTRTQDNRTASTRWTEQLISQHANRQHETSSTACSAERASMAKEERGDKKLWCV